MAAYSAFSEFNPYLWSNYKILAVDLGYGTDTVGPEIMNQKTLDYCKANAEDVQGNNYIKISPLEVTTEYSLLTDAGGVAVEKMGAKAARDGMAAQLIDAIQERSDSINNIERVPVEQKVKDSKDSLDNAKRELSDKKRAAAEDDDPNTNPEDYPTPEEVEDNPLDAFEILKESFAKSVLAQVCDVSKLSETEVKLESLPSHRSLNSGNLSMSESGSIVDRALYLDYILTNYEYYGHSLKHDGLKYEVEYLLGGKGTDPQNLAVVVEEILLIREAANFATIQKSETMKAEAHSIATVLTSFNPALEEVVAYGIMAAWAYAESVLDLRLLLSGGKVSVIKDVQEWTSDVWHLSQVAKISFKAKENKNGIGYKEYLLGFLALKPTGTLSMRALDVMENALSTTEDYSNVSVDNMVWAADFKIDYTADEMFLSLFEIPGIGSEEGQYSFSQHKMLEY